MDSNSRDVACGANGFEPDIVQEPVYIKKKLRPLFVYGGENTERASAWCLSKVRKPLQTES